MSVSDPLLKELKGNILKFVEFVNNDSSYVLDSCCELPAVCATIEKILTCGFEHIYHGFGLTKVNYPWFWLNKVASCKHSIITFNYVNAVECVRKDPAVTTHLAKLRLLIRSCLQTKCLHIPIEYLIKTNQFLVYYKEQSILGNEILSEIFLSLLLQCSKINFKLDLANSTFLSTTWILPESIKIELVPCTSIGMSISFVGEHAVIVDIQSNSVISETAKVEVGDILDNLNGVHISSVNKGKLSTLLKNNKSQPVKLTIIKSKCGETNKLYEPMIPLLKKVKSSLNLKNHKECTSKKNTSAGFNATYVGSVDTGKVGDVHQIDNAVRLLLSPLKNNKNYTSVQHALFKKPVNFEIGELGVKVIDSKTLEVILSHSFMEISSCGSIQHLPNYFGYIAGNDHCNIASEFTCHIFHISHSDSVYTILQSIGQGFHRTHYVV